MPNNSDADAGVIFEYTGKGCVVPKYVTIVRFHPSVIEVENRAFGYCNKLWKVMFNDGLQKIGWWAFYGCTSLSSIKLPSTVVLILHLLMGVCKQVIIILKEAIKGAKKKII